MSKLVLLNNDFINNNIINISLNSLIPYFTELMSTNFYLLLPEKFINMVRFFIKFLAYHFFISNDSTSIKNANTKKLIQIFVDLNFKLLSDENTSSNFFFDALDNIKFIYNLLFLLNEDLKEHAEDDDENGINEFNNKEIADFKYYIQEKNFYILLKLIKNQFDIDDKIETKYFSEFILYFNPYIFTKKYDENEKNIMIEYIVAYIKSGADKHDFWFKTFVMELLIKNKLITKIKKAENILNNYEQIDEEKKDKLKKYFILISKILYFISIFIKNDDILEKYFNLYIDKKDSIDQEKIQKDESFIKEKECENKINVYCSLVYISKLIIKFLLNNNFFKFCKKKMNYINKHDFKVKILIRECFNFFATIISTIPKTYEDIIEKKEKNKNKRKKKKNKKNEEKEKVKELNEDLMNFYIKIINNIKVNDIMRLLALLENNLIMRSTKERRKSQLRKIIKNLNEIEAKYNLFPKESHSLENSQNSNNCPICLDKESDIHLNPCEHMFCYSCIQKLTDRRCPICRKTILGVKEHPEFRFKEHDSNNINNIRIFHVNNRNFDINNRNMYMPNIRFGFMPHGNN